MTSVIKVKSKESESGRDSLFKCKNAAIELSPHASLCVCVKSIFHIFIIFKELKFLLLSLCARVNNITHTPRIRDGERDDVERACNYG